MFHRRRAASNPVRHSHLLPCDCHDLSDMILSSRPQLLVTNSMTRGLVAEYHSRLRLGRYGRRTGVLEQPRIQWLALRCSRRGSTPISYYIADPGRQCADEANDTAPGLGDIQWQWRRVCCRSRWARIGKTEQHWLHVRADLSRSVSTSRCGSRQPSRSAASASLAENTYPGEESASTYSQPRPTWSCDIAYPKQRHWAGRKP